MAGAHPQGDLLVTAQIMDDTLHLVRTAVWFAKMLKFHIHKSNFSIDTVNQPILSMVNMPCLNC